MLSRAFHEHRRLACNCIVSTSGGHGNTKVAAEAGETQAKSEQQREKKTLQDHEALLREKFSVSATFGLSPDCDDSEFDSDFTALRGTVPGKKSKKGKQPDQKVFARRHCALNEYVKTNAKMLYNDLATSNVFDSSAPMSQTLESAKEVFNSRMDSAIRRHDFQSCKAVSSVALPGSDMDMKMARLRGKANFR